MVQTREAMPAKHQDARASPRRKSQLDDSRTPDGRLLEDRNDMQRKAIECQRPGTPSSSSARCLGPALGHQPTVVTGSLLAARHLGLVPKATVRWSPEVGLTAVGSALTAARYRSHTGLRLVAEGPQQRLRLWRLERRKFASGQH